MRNKKNVSVLLIREEHEETALLTSEASFTFHISVTQPCTNRASLASQSFNSHGFEMVVMCPRSVSTGHIAIKSQFFIKRDNLMACRV